MESRHLTLFRDRDTFQDTGARHEMSQDI